MVVVSFYTGVTSRLEFLASSDNGRHLKSLEFLLLQSVRGLIIASEKIYNTQV